MIYSSTFVNENFNCNSSSLVTQYFLTLNVDYNIYINQARTEKYPFQNFILNFCMLLIIFTLEIKESLLDDKTAWRFGITLPTWLINLLDH